MRPCVHGRDKSRGYQGIPGRLIPSDDHIWTGDRLTILPLSDSSDKVTSALVDALFANVSSGWRYDFGLAAIPGVILLLGFFFCPESPR